jgi:glycosyltransferase involved in cell wall biosynthesis
MNKNIPLLSVCCITYNHELYIRDTIEGFLIQKTTFPIEIIIHDDASTDKTAEIIKGYFVKFPDLIIPVLQAENQYSKGIKAYSSYVWPQACGKYIALCEGDDYWTDPFKLQKQVDFLESNPDYGLVHSELDHYYVSSDKLIKNYWAVNKINIQSGDIYRSLINGRQSMIYACTACFRTEFIKRREYKEIVDQNFLMGDVPLWLLIALNSKIGYLKESTAEEMFLLFLQPRAGLLLIWLKL